jgi:RNA polymerase sigma-70 factor (ECF subfamily)
MTDPARHHADDLVTRRVREAFADLEPSVELDEVVERAAPYLRRMARPARYDKGAPGVQPAVAVDRLARTRWVRGALTPGGVELAPADLVAARRRDPAALARIYQAFAPALLRFFVAAVGDRRAAEDLTGTVFAAAIEDLPGFHGDLDKFGGWLFRIARHDLYDYRRRAARARTEDPDDVLDEATLAEESPDRWEWPVARLEASRVVAAMEQLSTDQHEVLLLRLAAGLTVGEVAATLGKTTGAVKALQHRGLASLARKLTPATADQRQDAAERRGGEPQPDPSGRPERPGPSP